MTSHRSTRRPLWWLAVSRTSLHVIALYGSSTCCWGKYMVKNLLNLGQRSFLVLMRQTIELLTHLTDGPHRPESSASCQICRKTIWVLTGEMCHVHIPTFRHRTWPGGELTELDGQPQSLDQTNTSVLLSLLVAVPSCRSPLPASISIMRTMLPVSHQPLTPSLGFWLRISVCVWAQYSHKSVTPDCRTHWPQVKTLRLGWVDWSQCDWHNCT